MDSGESSPKLVLDPVDRISEILSGLIGTIAFTGSISIATVGPAEVRSMLVSAVGCNLAWGIMDGVIYLMGSLAAKGNGLKAFRAVRAAASREEGQRAVANALPESVAAVLQPGDLEPIRERVVQVPEPSALLRLDKNDWLGAVSVCLLVVCCTFPVVIPFLFMQDGRHALRTSHGIAIVMLFFTGFMEGRNLRHRPWAMGFAMVLLGSALAGLTIALGG